MFSCARLAPVVLQIAPMEDFPIEQSQEETPCHAFDQVIKIDGRQVHPNTALTPPYSVVIREKLYRAGRDAQTGEEITQLLVPLSRWETIFQEAHPNPIAGHLGYDKTLNWITAQFTGRAFGRM